MPLFVLVFETGFDVEVWLLSVVARDGRRSSLSKIRSRGSLSPVSGRIEDERWSLGASVLKLLREVRPWVESGGNPSSIQGAMSALGRSIDCWDCDRGVVNGLAPRGFLFSGPWSKREPLIASTGVASSGESEKKVPLMAWAAELRAALSHASCVSIQDLVIVRIGMVARLEGLELCPLIGATQHGAKVGSEKNSQI